jgi:transcriptional activator for dhaKLM operon
MPCTFGHEEIRESHHELVDESYLGEKSMLTENVDHSNLEGMPQSLSSASEAIAESRRRCALLLDPDRPLPGAPAGESITTPDSPAQACFLAQAWLYLENISSSIEGIQMAFVLVDGAGMVRIMLGNEQLLKDAGEQGIMPGASLAERHAGTNAFALALIERAPIEVQGTDHFCLGLKGFGEVAFPICDSTGKVLGALGLLSYASHHPPCFWTLAASAARTIETQIQAEEERIQLADQLARFSAIFSTLGTGIISWDQDGFITYVNSSAEKILELCGENLIGHALSGLIQFSPAVQHELDEYIKYYPTLQKEFHEKKSLTDQETFLIVGKREISCILTLRLLPNDQGLVALIREPKEVRRLVQRQIGAQAMFSLDDLKGVSPQIQKVRRLVKSAALAQASGLITGELGTGKDLLARIVHSQGPYYEGPFILFPCSSIPSELFVPELLGYEEAPITKGVVCRPSKFELAEGGTLYFKDIDIMPLEAQAILLNILEGSIIQHIGGRQPIKVHVRILSSTTCNLEDLVAQGRFNAKLHYWLRAFEIQVPPLRERKEDIPVIAESILKRIASRLSYSLDISPEAMSLLQAYPWPSNIRELEAILERAAASLGKSRRIESAQLPDVIRHPEVAMMPARTPDQSFSLEQIQLQALLQTAKDCRGNTVEMSTILGISRTTLWRWLKRFDISLEDYRGNTP